jgi:hypothetical protein
MLTNVLPFRMVYIDVLVHVSYALILGLKDEPYDEGIIVHVFLCCRVCQVGCAHGGTILPC